MKTMTKEIKFRGKDISNGSWRYGYYFSIKRNGRHFIKHPELFNDYEVDQSSVGQFTGLKDKYGVDIYEGDLIIDHIGFGFIEYHHSGFRINYNNGLCKWPYDYMQKEFETIEVIGNIYEKEVQDD